MLRIYYYPICGASRLVSTSILKSYQIYLRWIRTYLTGLRRLDLLVSVMSEHHQIMGAVAAVSMILILLTANGFVRKRCYEIFFGSHIILVVIVLIAGTFSQITFLE